MTPIERMHIHNGRIWTGDPAQRWADSITIGRGVVEAIDRAGEPPADAVVIDAGRRTIAPGLIDSHLHLLMGGRALSELDLSGVTSREEFEAAIAARQSELHDGEWLIGRGWSQENWGGEMPDKSWLRAAGSRPCVCYRMDIHACLVNDAVLKLCDLESDPPGGRIGRDARTGGPTGLMVESAAWSLVNPLMPQPSVDTRQQHLLAAQARLHALGLTSVGSMEYAKDLLEVLTPMRAALTLGCAVTLLDRGWPMSFAVGANFANDDRLKVIGYKAYIDGTLGSRSARMLRAYDDDPGNRGMLVELAAEGKLINWARGVRDAGLSPAMHAIGDEAVRLALDVVEAVGAGRRPRIEHAQHVDSADVPRCAGVIASMQPLHKADDGRSMHKRLGEARCAHAFAFRALRAAGARLAFGSDWPVVSCDPLLGIRSAITGLTLDEQPFHPEQNLTVEEALRAYTADAAFALQLNDVGVLRPGAKGDLVMFDRDPFAADWVTTPPRVEMTIAGGAIVYDANGAKTAKDATRQQTAGGQRQVAS